MVQGVEVGVHLPLGDTNPHVYETCLELAFADHASTVIIEFSESRLGVEFVPFEIVADFLGQIILQVNLIGLLRFLAHKAHQIRVVFVIPEYSEGDLT